MKAHAADVMRSVKKDEVIAAHMREQMFEVARKVIGTQFAVKKQKEIEVLSDVAYFTLCAILPHSQTLGEEYVEIGTTATTMARAVAFTLSIFVPFVVSLAPRCLPLLLLHHHNNHDDDAAAAAAAVGDDGSRSHHPITQRAMEWSARNAREIGERVEQAHTAVFFGGGEFCEISKRLCAVSLFVTRSQQRQSQQPNFVMFSGLFALRVTLAVTKLANDFRQSVVEKSSTEFSQQQQQLVEEIGDVAQTPETATASSTAPKCMLCLEARRQPTATPCGHVFCWDCLGRALSVKDECPLCRKQVHPASVIRVFNLDS